MPKKSTSEINFKFTLDEKNIPEAIEWIATDAQKKEVKDCKSVMISIWGREEKNTLTLNLWTKDMPMNEMYAHFFQTLVTLAESFQRATGNTAILEDMKQFCDDFSKKTGLFDQQGKQK